MFWIVFGLIFAFYQGVCIGLILKNPVAAMILGGGLGYLSMRYIFIPLSGM